MTSGGVEDDKNRSVVTDHQHHQHHQPPPPPAGGAPFQGVSNYPPPPQQQQQYQQQQQQQQYQQPPANGYPQPAPGYPQPAQPYVPGYAVAGGMHSTDHHRLPCCGLGIGWVLFILGIFFGIPWYIGFFLFFFSKNPRERPGYVACTIAAVILTILIIIGAIRGSGAWH